MIANFTPNKNEVKKIGSFKLWCKTNFPFIEADFDALTNYEIMCQMSTYLNDVIKNTNALGEDVASMYQAFISLQNYVNHFFDNLNLQNEVNKKLDLMAEDGTLLDILSNYAHLEKLFDTRADMISDTGLQIGQKVKCFGTFQINDGMGGEFLINDVSGEIELDNGLFAKLINNYQDSFYSSDEIIVTKERINDTDCYITEIPLNDSNNKQIDIYIGEASDRSETPLKYAINHNTSFTCNAVLYIHNETGTGTEGIPTVIANGEIIHDNSMFNAPGIPDDYLYLGITPERDIQEFVVNDTTNEQLLASGCTQVFNAYYKLIENYQALDLEGILEYEAGLVDGFHPRQAIGIKDDKTIIILTTDGRTEHDKGLTSVEMQNILRGKGCKNAWNLDGGGSTSTMINGLKINRSIDDSGTTDRYVPYTLNIKKDTINKNIADAISNQGNIKNNVVNQLLPIIQKMHNVTGKDADTIIAKLYFAFGNRMTNTPEENGYLLNLTNPIENNKFTYNKQFFIGREKRQLYVRSMNNGAWSPWEPIGGSMIEFLYPTGAEYHVQVNNTYEKIPITQLQNYDFDNVILNEDGSFSVKGRSRRYLKVMVECRVKGAGGVGIKFLKLQKNGSDVLYTSTTTPDTTNQYQLTLFAPIYVGSETDKFTLLAYGISGDIYSQMKIYVMD